MYQPQQAQQPSLPHSPPFVIQIQLSQQLQPMLPFITGITMKRVADNAASNKNALRAFLGQILSQNNWQNQEFAQLVQQVGWMGEYYIHTDPRLRQQPEQAFDTAVEDCSRHLMARYAQEYHGQLANYITQDIAMELNKAAAGAQQWAAEMRRFHQQLAGAVQQFAPPAYGGGPGYMQQQQQQPMPVNGPSWLGGGPQQQPMYPNNGYVGGVQRVAYATPQHQQPYQQQPAYGGRHAVSSYGGNAPYSAPGFAGNEMKGGLKPRRASNPDTNTMLSMDPNGKRELRTWSAEEEAHRLEVERHTGTQRNTGTFQFNPPNATPLVETAPQYETWPKLDNPERPFDGMTFEDGTYMKPAATSGWVKTFDPSKPYTPIYNPEKFILFHLKRPDGTVLEQLEPRTDEMDMDYVQHETDPKLRAAALEQRRSDSGEIVPEWKLATHMRESNREGMYVSAPNENKAEDDLPVSQPRVLESVPITHSLQEGLLKLSGFAKSSEVEPGQLVEMVFEVVTPLMTTGDLGSVMKIFESATSFEEFRTRLYDHREALTDEVAALIDQRLTASINDGLRYHMGLAHLYIDSFADDYIDLLGVLKNQYGEGLVNSFVENAPEMIGRSMAVLTDSSLASYLTTQNIGDVDVANCMLVFRDRCNVTQVPWSLADMKIDLSHANLIPESMVDFREAVLAIFSRTEDWPVSFAHRYLQTSDKKLLELRRGYLDENAYLINLVND